MFQKIFHQMVFKQSSLHGESLILQKEWSIKKSQTHLMCREENDAPFVKPKAAQVCRKSCFLHDRTSMFD